MKIKRPFSFLYLVTFTLDTFFPSLYLPTRQPELTDWAQEVEGEKMAKWLPRIQRYAHYMAEGMLADGSGLTCAICARDIRAGLHNSRPEAATVDHLDPRALTGELFDRRPWNLVCVCQGCNSRKKDRTMQAYLAGFSADYAAAAWARIGQRLASKVNFGDWITAAGVAGYSAKKRSK